MAKLVGVDKWLFFTTLLLVVVGLVMVFSASAVVAQERYHSALPYVGRQAGWALAGVLAMVVLMNIDASRYKSPRFIYPALCVTTLLLVMVFFVPGSHNTHRWIRFGASSPFSLLRSPSRCWCFFWRGFSTPGSTPCATGSTPCCRAAIDSAGLYSADRSPARSGHRAGAGRRHRHDAGAGRNGVEVPGWPASALALPAWPRCFSWCPGAGSACLSSSIPTPIQPRAQAIHINQSLIAVGTGGLTGRGYMEGMQKLFYLPEASTDFIFANIAEELGFIGAITILLLFVVFGVRGLRAAFRSQDPFRAWLLSASPRRFCCRPSSTSAWCCRWSPPRASRCR